MSSFVEEAQHMAGSQLKKVRWALGISGVLSIALGVVIVIWPSISLYSLVIVFGAFALARGVVGLATAFSSSMKEGRGWLVASSLANIVVGVVVFFYTDMSALALLYVIGAYAIVFGIIEIGGAFWLPLMEGGDRVLLTLTGFLSIVFGIIMFAKPGAGALAVLALIAAYAIVIGVAELVVAIGGERLFKRSLGQLTSPARPQTSH
jgi:uncharacterized membrane protein HdeD (DUF308 family)